MEWAIVETIVAKDLSALELKEPFAPAGDVEMCRVGGADR